jgi:hypothetical protein
MAWTTISNALVAVGAKPFATTIQALRDNPGAIAEGATGAPVVSAGWHPYNMVSIGDGNDGKFYDNAINGNQASITTPTFEDGFEYVVRWSGLSSTSGAVIFRINAVALTGNTATAADTVSGAIFIPYARVPGLQKFGMVQNRVSSASNPGQGPFAYTGAANNVYLGAWSFNTEAALSSIALSFSGGNIDAGQAFLYRRRFTL